MSDTLNSGEVKRLLGVSYQTLTNWRLKGILVPAFSLPTGRYRYSKTQIEEFQKRFASKG